MKEFLLFFMFIPFILYSQDGQVKFKVKSNHYYEFKIPLRGNTQYIFKLNGESLFNFRIVEPSGNEWELRRAYFVDINKWELTVHENIMDKGTYTIKISTIADNLITLSWEEY